MQVDAHYTNGTLVIQPTGDWRLESPIPTLRDVVDPVDPAGSVEAVAFDTDELGE